MSEHDEQKTSKDAKWIILTNEKMRDCIIECVKCGNIEIDKAPVVEQIYKIRLKKCQNCTPKNELDTGAHSFDVKFFMLDGTEIRDREVKLPDGKYLFAWFFDVFGYVPSYVLKNAVNPEVIGGYEQKQS